MRTEPNPAHAHDIRQALLGVPRFLKELDLSAEDVEQIVFGNTRDHSLQQVRDSRVKHIGSGLFAHVFALPSGLVLKITLDEDDAQAAELIRKAGSKGKQPAGLPKILTVRRLPGLVEHTEPAIFPPDQKFAIYAIVVEPLTELVLPSERLLVYGLKSWLQQRADLGLWTKAASDANRKIDRFEPLDSFPDLSRRLDEAMQGVKWLQAHGFAVRDLHVGNFGETRDGRSVLFDFGNSSKGQDRKPVPIKVARNPKVVGFGPGGAIEAAAGVVSNGQRPSKSQVASVWRALGSPVVDMDELRMGIEVEQEHTDDVQEAGKIAMDHLREFPDYYTRLTKMEARAKAGLAPNAKKQRHDAETGLDWTKPDTWPDSIEHRQFAHDFRVLLEDHGFAKPSYDIVHIRLVDVTVPEIDYDDDRDHDPRTGEPSDAYMDGLVVAMRSGVRMPPAVVGNVDEDGGRSTPWGHPYDGRHRLNAAKRLGLKWFPAIDVTGTGEGVVPNGRSKVQVESRERAFKRLGAENNRFAAALKRIDSKYGLKDVMSEYANAKSAEEFLAVQKSHTARVAKISPEDAERREQIMLRWEDMISEKIGLMGRGRPDIEPNGRSKVHASFDRHFDEAERAFPDLGTIELHEDEAAGSDNGAGSERQFGYCADEKPIVIAFAPKAEELPKAYIDGLMAHEFGHAIEFRYGRKHLEKLWGRLPESIERRADKIAEYTFGRPIEYGSLDIQCIGCGGKKVRPRRLG